MRYRHRSSLLQRLIVTAAFAGALSPALSAPSTYHYRLKLTGVSAVGAPSGGELSVSLAASSLPSATVGQAYSANLSTLLSVTGDAAYSGSGVTWGFVSNTLPAGLYLTADGYIGGTPSASGTGDILVRASYQTASGEQTYTIVVNGVPLLVKQISAGVGTTCAVTVSGGLKCWGFNGQGQLGNNDAEGNDSFKPVDVVGLTSGVASVSVGPEHVCAVTTSGGVKCWGTGLDGQLGDGARDNRLTPVDVVGLTSGVASVSVGFFHTCALTSSGGVKCWGFGGAGALGDGTWADALTPVDVFGLTSGVASISVGDFHSCAVTTSGGVKCWGSDTAGKLGNDAAIANQPRPVDVLGLTSGVASVSASNGHTCAVTTSGGAKCWGWDDYGQLGNDAARASRPTPVDVAGLTSGVASISAGFYHTCALTTAGGVKCWGTDEYGALGNDAAFVDQPTPVDVAGLSSGVMSISAGNGYTCAVIAPDRGKCWGDDWNGQLADDANEFEQATPVDVMQ